MGEPTWVRCWVAHRDPLVHHVSEPVLDKWDESVAEQKYDPSLQHN